MAGLRWNSVNANFNDVNSAMGNCLSGLSQAGTIFGDLRKSILDEEQRAIDNAYREKAFDENVRQFGLNYALDEDKLFETGRHNKESERLMGRGQDLTHEAAMADVGVRQDRLDMDKDTLALDQQFRKDYADAVTYFSGTREALEKQITQGRTELEAAKESKSLTPEQIAAREIQLEQMETRLRTELS